MFLKIFPYRVRWESYNSAIWDSSLQLLACYILKSRYSWDNTLSSSWHPTSMWTAASDISRNKFSLREDRKERAWGHQNPRYTQSVRKESSWTQSAGNVSGVSFHLAGAMPLGWEEEAITIMPMSIAFRFWGWLRAVNIESAGAKEGRTTC